MAKKTEFFCKEHDDHEHFATKFPHIGMYATVQFGILRRPYRVVWLAHMVREALIMPCDKDGAMVRHFRFPAVFIAERGDGYWYQKGVSLPNPKPVEMGRGVWRD